LIRFFKKNVIPKPKRGERVQIQSGEPSYSELLDEALEGMDKLVKQDEFSKMERELVKNLVGKQLYPEFKGQLPKEEVFGKKKVKEERRYSP